MNDKLNNKGYSLVELITTLTIMVVVIGVIGLGYNTMYSKDAAKVAGTIDDELSNLRMLTMSKTDDCYMELNIVSGQSKNNYIEIFQGGSSIKTVALNRKVEIAVDNGKGYSASGDQTIKIKFNKGTGAVEEVDGTSEGIYEFNVKTVRGSFEREAKVKLIAVTGRHSVEK